MVRVVAYSGLTWTPPDNGLILATHDPAMSGVSCDMVNGRVYVARMVNRSPSAATVSNLWFIQLGSPAAAGPSTGTYCGVYSSAGVLQSGSADIGATIVGNGQYPLGPLPLNSSVTVGAWAYCYAAILLNLVTPPLLQGCIDEGGFVNAGLVGTNASQNGPASKLRWAVVGTGWQSPVTGQTSLPGSFNPANLAIETVGIWAGAS